MTRIRRAAPKTMSLGLLLAGCTMTLSAQGMQVSRADMESFVYTVIAAAGVCVVGAFWILLTTMTGRTEQAVDRLIATMQQHHEDPLAHPAGSANRINPVMERLGEIEGRLDKTHELLVMLHSEHRIIQRQESEICALIHKRRAEAKRRETDPPGFNGEPLRREDP